MKLRIAFATEDDLGLDATLAQHFGKCPFYTFVDVEDGRVVEVLSVPNPAAEGHSPGEIPRFIAEQNCDIIVSGGMGPRAQNWFLSLGIKPYVGLQGKVREALSLIIEGKVEPVKEASECEHDHHH